MQTWPTNEAEEVALFCKMNKFADLHSVFYCFEQYVFNWTIAALMSISIFYILFLNPNFLKFRQYFFIANLFLYFIYPTLAFLSPPIQFSLSNLTVFIVILPFLTVANILLLIDFSNFNSKKSYYAAYALLALIQIGWNAGLRAA